MPTFTKLMMRIVLVLLTCLWGMGAFAQMSEDFSSSTVLDNPIWSGDVDDYVVVDGELRSDANEAGMSLILREYSLAAGDLHSWEIYARLEFAPSASNAVQLLLWAEDATDPLQSALALEWGQSGSDDALQVLRYTDGVPVLLASGSSGSLALQDSELRCRMTQSASDWRLEITYSDDVCFTEVLTWTEAITLPRDLYLGISSSYTSSRTKQFFFDDIYVDAENPLLGAPVTINSIVAISPTAIELELTQTLDADAAEDVAHYTLSPAISIASATADGRSLVIELSTPLLSGQDYLLDIATVVNCNGDTTFGVAGRFSYVELIDAGQDQVYVTEIMADPTPSVGMPDAEWLELYNSSSEFIDLSTIDLLVGTEREILPMDTLFPGDYVIICDDSDVDELSVYGRAIGLSTFPGITNGGEPITLESSISGDVLDLVAWTDEWYRDADREDGGYTLERIDPDNSCLTRQNWKASQASIGGTPGDRNSVFDSTMIDLSIGNHGYVSDSLYEISFNQRLDESSLTIDAFILSDPSLALLDVELGIDEMSIVLSFSSAPELGVEIILTLLSNISNCEGRALGEEITLILVRPFIAGPRDLLIHEILFDPQSGGADFVEIINSTDRFVSLEGVQLANLAKGEMDPIVGVLQLAPGGIIVWTDDREDILSRYTVLAPEMLIEQDIPSFNKSDGNVSLVDSRGVVIDSFDYDEDLHLALLDETKGVSLERLSLLADTQDGQNWYSASQSSGGATPTAINSQRIIPDASSMLRIENKTFSPNGDGYKDFLVLYLQEDLIGALGTVKVYDIEGREITSLADNTLFGANDILRWSGETADSGQARPGMYVIFGEFFTLDGTTRTIKESCVLAQRLD